MASSNPHRIPTNVRPKHYQLHLAPDLDSATFAGTVDIVADVIEPVSEIHLHAVDLDISATSVSTAGSSEIVHSIESDEENERITLTCESELQPGEVILRFTFEGTLNDQLQGFYRSTFEVEGVERTLAVTQMEATHARRAFPCFDEPEFKATFGIALTVEKGLLAVSNGAEVSREDLEGPESGKARLTFANTMVMSTYLVAFIVGPLEVTEAQFIKGSDAEIPLRVVYPPGMGHLCDFALEVADAGVRFFEEYYEIPYPGDKIDLVAVPDFAFGAMENLGCITFREVLLLIDQATATRPELQRVADVINHELAHMWFGDLVTMKWWNGIWLNEAFATFMEVSASDALNPSWDVWTTFGLARAAAFETDTLVSTRPIEFEVVTAADSEAMFDILTYEKGCSVVRMLEQYLGADVFREGIRTYLRIHAYGNTETTDLWDALEDVSGEPVRRMMDSWIFQGGYPQIDIRVEGDSATLSQSQASFAGVSSGSAQTEPQQWPIPAVVSFPGLEQPSPDKTQRATRLLLEGPVEVPLPSGAVAIQANAGGNGFYRCRPTQDIRLALAESESTALERFVLLDDSWFGFLTGEASSDELRSLVDSVSRQETNPSNWRRIAAIAGDLARLTHSDQRPGVRAWALTLAREDQRFPSADSATGDDAEVVGTLIQLAGVVGKDQQTQDNARSQWADPALHPSIQAGALSVVAHSCTKAEHDEIEQRWRNPNTPQEEQRYLGALVATGEPELFDHAVEMASLEVRSQDGPFLLRQALRNLDLGESAWSYIAENWHDLVERFPSSAYPRMLEGIRGFTDPELADRVGLFLDANPLEGGEKQIAQHREWMAVSVAVAARGYIDLLPS